MMAGILPGGIQEFPFYRFFRRSKADLLIPVIRRLRQAVPGARIIQDLRFLYLKGIVELADQYVPDNKIVADAAQEKGQDAGDDIDPAVLDK